MKVRNVITIYVSLLQSRHNLSEILVISKETLSPESEIEKTWRKYVYDCSDCECLHKISSNYFILYVYIYISILIYPVIYPLFDADMCMCLPCVGFITLILVSFIFFHALLYLLNVPYSTCLLRKNFVS